MMLFLYSDSLISQISQIFWENRIPSVHVRTTYDIENNTAHCQWTAADQLRSSPS